MNEAEVLDQSIEIIRVSGGSIQTILSSSIRLNDGSSLEREFVTIVDRSLPIVFTEGVGVVTSYQKATDYAAGSYIYRARAELHVLEEVRALEIRYLTFDVWGRHIQTLSATEIVDIAAGTQKRVESEWILFSENEASGHYASIAYVAAVRTASGKVLVGPSDVALREAQRFSTKFSLGDLEPRLDRR